MFLCEHAVWWNVARFILLLFVLAAGWFYGFLYDALLTNPEQNWRASRIDAGLHAIGITLVILLNYVPAFRPRSHYLHTLFPVSHRFRLGINLYGDQLSIVYGYAVIFIMMMVTGGSLFTIWNGMNALLFLLAVILLERTIKVFIEQLIPHLARFALLTAIPALSILLYLGVGIPEGLEEWRHPIQTLWFMLNASGTLLLYLRLSAKAGPVRARKPVINRTRAVFTSIDSFVRQVYLRRKATVVTLFMLVVSKLFVSVYGLLFMKRESDLFGDLAGYYLITLLLPVIPFSYVHNNMAGFFRESWTQLVVQSGEVRQLYRAYYGSVLPVLAADISISFIILGLTGLLNVQVALYYLLLLALYLPLGAISSLHHPRYIEKFFSTQNMASFRNNSSGLYQLLFFALALLMAVGLHAGILLWLVTPVLLISYILFRMLPTYYNKRRYALYAKLYEE